MALLKVELPAYTVSLAPISRSKNVIMIETWKIFQTLIGLYKLFIRFIASMVFLRTGCFGLFFYLSSFSYLFKQSIVWLKLTKNRIAGKVIVAEYIFLYTML